MIAYLFSVLLLPLFARMIKNKQPVNELVRLSFSLLFIAAIMVAMGAVFYNEPIMRLLYPARIMELPEVYELRISQSAQVFSLLMCGFIPISTTYVFGTLLTANGNLKQLNIVAAFGMILNIVMNLVLVPRLFAVGSAITSLTTQSITAILQVLLAQYFFRFKINFNFLIRMIIFAVGSLLMAWFSINLGLNWINSFISLMLLILAFSFLTRILSFKTLFEILKEYE